MGRMGRCLVLAALVASAAGASTPTLDSPLVASAKAGQCRMTVHGGNSSFLIVVTGLEPGESLQLTSNSEGEIGKWKSQAQDDGRYATIVIPLVIGKSFGTANLEVIGKRCRIAASFPWRE